MILPAIKVVQYAWVVDSLEGAIEGWTAMGVGPFYTMDICWEKAVYRGRTEPLSIRVGLAQAGASQIELVEQTSPGQSAFRDVVPQGRNGFHHVCSFTDDVSGDAAALTAEGIEIVQAIPRVGGQTALFMDTRVQLGSMLELIDPGDYLLSIYRLVADAARKWDRSDPIRPIASQLNP